MHKAYTSFSLPAPVCKN